MPENREPTSPEVLFGVCGGHGHEPHEALFTTYDAAKEYVAATGWPNSYDIDTFLFDGEKGWFLR